MTDSGFDLGLDDAARAGVFFVTSDDIATLDMASRDAGLLSRRIDLRVAIGSCRGLSTPVARVADDVAAARRECQGAGNR